MDESFFKLPRLYIDAAILGGVDIALSAEQAHYFKTVLRRQDGDRVRLFNGRDGEWACVLSGLGKKSGNAVPERQIRAQPARPGEVHLFFAPIKKARMDWMLEKAVELGATDLHPVLTQNTEIREINEKRLIAQIVETAEQCERLDLPRLHGAVRLGPDMAPPPGVVGLACLERHDARPILTRLAGTGPMDGVALLVGPEGGFTRDEATRIDQAGLWLPVSLGVNILRSETAVCAALGAVMFHREQSIAPGP